MHRPFVSLAFFIKIIFVVWFNDVILYKEVFSFSFEAETLRSVCAGCVTKRTNEQLHETAVTFKVARTSVFVESGNRTRSDAVKSRSRLVEPTRYSCKLVTHKSDWFLYLFVNRQNSGIIYIRIDEEIRRSSFEEAMVTHELVSVYGRSPSTHLIVWSSNFTPLELEQCTRLHFRGLKSTSDMCYRHVPGTFRLQLRYTRGVDVRGTDVRFCFHDLRTCEIAFSIIYGLKFPFYKAYVTTQCSFRAKRKVDVSKLIILNVLCFRPRWPQICKIPPELLKFQADRCTCTVHDTEI